MKKQLIQVDDEVPGTCVGCEFFIPEAGICKRGWEKNEACINIIYLLREITKKKKRAVKKAC